MISFKCVVLLCIFYLRTVASELKVPQPRFALTPCTTNTDCSGFENSKCINDFCECNGTKFCKEILSTKVTKLDEVCKIMADCIIENSNCTEGRCACVKGRVGTLDKRRCLKVADGLGSTCEDTIQCSTKVPLSECEDEKCTCQNGTHNFNNTCYESRGLGENCTHIGQCSHTAFARCDEGICTCKNGYVWNNDSNKCLEVAIRIKDPCFEHIQCSSAFRKSICKDGYCQCDEMFQFNLKRGMCVEDLLLGEKCEITSDCHGVEPGESRLECILGDCKCKSEFVEEHGICIISGGNLISNAHPWLAPTILLIYALNLNLF